MARGRRSKHPLAVWREQQTPPLTQLAAAQRVGMAQATWCRIERGEAVPRPLTAQQIERRTGVTVEALLHFCYRSRRAA